MESGLQLSEKGDSLLRMIIVAQTLLPYPTHSLPCLPDTSTALSNTRLPSRRSEEPARSAWIRIRHPNRRIQIIHIIIRDTDSPPRRHGGVGQIDR